jgi:ribonuclease HI
MASTHPWKAITLPDTGIWTLRFDGACSPNPGPMGIGYTLSRGDCPPLVRVGAQVGQGTNNVAEYQALLSGLRHALRLGMWRVCLESDSNLLVQQIAGKWAVRDGVLKRLHREAGMLLQCFRSWSIRHIYREDNTAADALSRTLENVSPELPVPPAGRALHGWQAAAINVWYWNRGVRSSAFLARIFGVQAVQVDQIIAGKSYKDVTFAGLPTWESAQPCPGPQVAGSIEDFRAAGA